VQLPGREGRVREEPFTRLEPLVASLTDALAQELTELPAAFFGHSMGALVAFETARELRRRGAREPVQLLVSARRAPHLPARHEPIHALPEAAFRDELRRLQGTPEAVLEHPELMELLEPMLRADFAVIETFEHRPAPPLNAPITAFGGAGDEDVPFEDLDAWSRHTAGGFRRRSFRGGHFFLQHEARRDLLRAVAAELAPRP
jgi:medium-chain acyl-[acyl-carrier-protein] hydrolase